MFCRASKSSRHMGAERKVLNKIGKKEAQRRWLIGSSKNWNELFGVFTADNTGLVFPPRKSTDSADEEEPMQCSHCGCHLDPGEGTVIMDLLEHRRRSHAQKALLKQHLAEKHGKTWPPTLPPVLPPGPAHVLADAKKIVLWVVDSEPSLRISFLISKDQYLGKIFDSWCGKMRVQSEHVRFVLNDGRVINGTFDTSKKLGLEEGDIIKAVVEEAVVKETNQNNT